MSNPKINISKLLELNHRYGFYFYLDVLRKNYSGLSINPISIEIHPTDKCNLNCNFCYNHTMRLKGNYSFIKRNDWDYILKTIESNISLKNVILNGGGEPLKYPREQLDELFYIIKKNNLLLTLLTNGTLLDASVIQSISGINCLINISIKSISRKDFISITGMDLFELQMKNIHKVLEISRQHNTHLIIARYVFSESTAKNFDVTLFGIFLQHLFEYGLDAFLFTFSRPSIGNKSSDYKRIYEKISNNKSLAPLISQGQIRFSNLRYLEGHYPDIRTKNPRKINYEGQQYKCHIKNIFLIFNQHGKSKCIKDLDKNLSNEKMELNRCNTCIFYFNNLKITSVLDYLEANDIRESTPNGLIHGIRKRNNGFLNDNEFTYIDRYVNFITNSKNPAVRGLPFVLH